MKRTVLIFTIMSILAKIIAFGRELILSYYFGAGQISDVFLLSMTLPVTIFGFVAAGVTSGYIPVYQKVNLEKGKEFAVRFTSNVINILVGICLIVILVYFLFPRTLLGIFASGFDAPTMGMACKFTDFSIWATICTALVTVLTGYLQINDQIKITAFASVPLNVSIIITIIFAKAGDNVYILPVGFLISSIIQVIFLWVICRRCGYRWSFVIDLKDKYINFFLSSLIMLIFSGSLQQINVLIDRTLATTVTIGGLSVFEYGNKISDFVMGLTIVPISAALFPMMTKEKDNADHQRRILTEGIRVSSIIIIPASIIMVIFAEAIVKIIYFRGAFDESAVKMTTQVVMLYGVGLLAFSLREIMIKCLYAVGDVKSPMINSAIGVICNIFLNIVLLKVVGLGGLALATSISALLCVILLYASLKKHIEGVYFGQVIIICMELFVVSGVQCFVARVIYDFLLKELENELIPFLAAMLYFSAAYLLSIVFTKIVDWNEIKGLLKRNN